MDQTKGCYVVSEPAETLGEVSERLHYWRCNPEGCTLHCRYEAFVLNFVMDGV